ncbi:MAG TPA: carboxypeptidase-like regulatory domain-containing protein [Gemmatimonadales bacterium]|nr:carboxypeptidase-like regulatory domain-containing protein [Gemmatimonadales bacterium]
MQRLLATVTFIALAFPRLAAAQGTEIVKGRVIDTHKMPIAGVDVTITGQTTGAVQTIKSDAKGEYLVTFRDPQGTYALAFRKLGYGAFSRTVRQAGLSNIIDAGDAVLPGGLTLLQPIVASTSRLQKVPTRSEFPSVGGAEVNTANNALFLLDPNDLNQLAAHVPGVQNVGDSAYSVLGAPPSQNKTVIDGLDLGGTNLPRDAIGSAKLVTNTFDPAKGQFSGATTVVTLRHGSELFAGKFRAQLLDPHLAWGDPEAPAPVPQIGYASGYVTGAIVPHRIDFFAAFDGNNRVTATPSLLDPRTALLTQLGISPDSVAAAASALGTLGVPLTTAQIPVNPATLRGEGYLTVDYHMNPVTSFTLSTVGDWSRYSGSGVSELAFPSASGKGNNSQMSYLLDGGTYFHRILEDFRFGLVAGGAHAEPYLALPSGSVLVGESFASGPTGLSAFRFGGSGAGNTRSTTRSWELNNSMSWATTDTKQQITVTEDVRREWGGSDQLSSPFGAYTYQSLADLATNTPSSYTKALSEASHAYDGRVWALSLGDIWRAIPGKLDFQWGARFDARTFETRPAYNPAVDSLFGVRTDHVPTDRGASPTFGFSWSPKGRRNGILPEGMMVINTKGATGGAVGRKSVPDAAGLGLLPPGSDAVLSGGVRAYRGTISSSRVGSLTDATGLSGTTQYLSCVGSATPIPDWSGGSGASPSACLDGSGPASYAAVQPRVNVFDPRFEAPVSWRGALQLKGLDIHGWPIAPQLTYSVGLHSESAIDLNLQRASGFTLPGEANRPVYASPTDIVPSTGLFAPTAGRVSTAYGRVTETLSDLQYHAAQLLIPFEPGKPLFGRIPIYFVYALNIQRAQQRGFTGTTAGDPFAVEWVDGRQSRHQFTVGANNIRIWWFTLATRLDLFSGVPYTPVVSGDINGDGTANDRAFIPTAQAGGDTALASQMAALMAAAPAGARNCLTAQIGAIAGANSCRTPWQAQLDLNLAFTPPQSIGLGSRLKVTTTLLNTGGALVRLFGLNNTPLGQTSQSTAVDPRLLYVTGFDPVRQQFQYQVNQLFGQPLDYGAARHRYAPFELQLGLEYRIGYPSTVQTAKNFGVNGKDTVGMAARVRADVRRRTFGADPAAEILGLRDTLHLSADQIASIGAVSREYTAHVDSVIAPIVTFMVQRGNKLTSDDYNSRIQALGNIERAYHDAERAKAVAFLLPDQRSKLATLTHTL